MVAHALLLLLALSGASPARSVAAPSADTIRLEVGSPEVDGRVFPVHRARNRVYPPGATEPVVTWTNELLLGDSAGVPVMRWITRGEPLASSPSGATWELLQTYHARTMAPMAYQRTAGDGSVVRFRVEGNRVRGTRRAPGETADRPIDQTLDRLGFIASASDLVPMAVGLRPGTVMTAPVWGPNMAAPEERVFEVFDREVVEVEGEDVSAYRVEERIRATGELYATWYLTLESPFMVLGEIVLPDGQIQRITGVALHGGD